MKYVQPARDLCVAVTIACLVAAWWLLIRSHTTVYGLPLMETALIFSILGETYAVDRE